MYTRTFLTVLVLIGLMSFAAPAQALIYVDVAATGANNGSSWVNAYTDLQNALSAANPGEDVWVAEGTYTPAVTFQLLNGVGLYGGFPSSGGPWASRNWVANQTTLSRSGSGNVVTGTGTDNTAVLDGFTVTNGGCGLYSYGSGSPTVTNCTFSGNGTGVYNYLGSPIVTNCTFSENNRGMTNSSSGPTLINCTFSENSASYESHGAGMYNNNSSPTLTNCTFIGNTTNGNHTYGAGILARESNLTLTNCTFIGNRTGDWDCRGGGIYSYWSCTLTLTNCAFIGNCGGTRGWSQGGGVHDREGTLTLTNCTFVGNSAAPGGNENGCGGGLYTTSSAAMIRNCIFWGNGAHHGPQIYATYGGVNARYSCIQGGWSGTGNISSDPQFVDYSGGDYRLSSANHSPCIDRGNNADVPGGITTDLDGHPRFVDDPDTTDGGSGTPPIVDMGAYEYQLPVPDDQLLLTVAPGSQCVTTNGTVEVTLDVAHLTAAINGTQARVHYDPARLSLVSITPAADWVLIAPFAPNNPDPDGDGDLTCALYLPGGSVSEDGTVATLQFDPLTEGATQVVFQSDNHPFHTKLTRASDSTTIFPYKENSGLISIDNTQATADNNSPVCEGGTIELYGGPDNGPDGPYTYSWTGPDNFNSTYQNPTISNATLAMDGTYTLTVTNASGCEFTAETEVTVELCIVVNLEIEGLIGNNGEYGHTTVWPTGAHVNREVTFVFTDCVGATDTYVLPVTFTAQVGTNRGVGSVTFTGLDAGFDWLSVQEGHALRKLVAVDFVSTLADSVTVFLSSGDFHTVLVVQDNLVDITDFSILASSWETVIDADESTGGDATGDGYHDAGDFALIQPNFLEFGDEASGCTKLLSDVGRVPPAAFLVGVVSRTPRAGISVSELSLTVPHAERADLDGNGVIDARDIRAFARRHNLCLQPSFDAKLLELEQELIELEPAVDSGLKLAPRRTR
ncbi:MAG: right-handed parallel beta-helix repeat-containing protein [Phycisphaerae bacterium]|nr:right-handed parallel beta-helix repeat-containing protein [Phycisphaerae bacterium]